MKNWFRLSLVVVFLFCEASSFAAVSLLDANGWKIGMGGFIETDSITDSTRGFNENIGNNPVVRPDASNGSGQTGREMMSIRNSRLSFGVAAPESEGWKTKSYFEFDLLGYDPAPTTQSEAAFMQNPTFRIRHAYLQADKDAWTFMAGQYWNLLGWQPYYFVPTIEVQPVAGMLYNRTPQFRAIRNIDFNTDTHAQVALGVMRPPQRDANFPALEAGVRLSYDGWSAGYAGSASAAEKAQPLSVGVSYAFREFEVGAVPTAPTGDQNHYPGHALAIDAQIPVIPSSDGKDPGNTFMLGGELTTGTGYGDEWAGWTGGMVSPLGANANSPYSKLSLDAGIGGFDQNDGHFALIDLTSLNLYGQYHLPSAWRAWISGGYARLYSDTIANLTATAFTSSAYSNGYNKEDVFFGNFMKELTDQIRVGFEYSQTRTVYNDGVMAHDNRYQFSAFFIF